MSSGTTQASPKRSDAWLAEATAVTGASAFKRSDMMAREIAAAAHAGRPGGVSRGRASHLAVLCAAAVDVDLTDRKGAWAREEMERGMAEHWMGCRGEPRTGQTRRDGTGVKRHCSDREKREDSPSPFIRKECR